MINEKTDLFIKQMHNIVQKKYDSQRSDKKNISNETLVMENRVLYDYTRFSDYPWKKYAENMKRQYGYDLQEDDIIDIVRRRMGGRDRHIMLKWAKELSRLFYIAVNSGKIDDFKKFKEKRLHDIKANDGKRRYTQDRIGCIMIFSQNKMLHRFDDFSMLECFSNAEFKYFIREFTDLLAARCGAGINTSKSKTIALNLEQSQHRIEELERELERANIRIDDLEGDMDDHIRNAERTVLLEFFSKFNSDKYGSLLDQLLIMNGKIGKMQKNIDLPPELNGIFITIKNMVKFIRDNSLEPVAIPHSRHKVKLSDMDFWDYDGTPFTSEDEEKEIEVISPGWKHVKLEMQISRPKVKEVMQDDN